MRAAPLARSARAIVYRGWDLPRCRRVLVKTLRTAGDPTAASRFGREAAVLLRLRHPNIVRLYAFYAGGPAEDPAKTNPAALVMEYVPGATLAALVAADGYLSPVRTAQIIADVAAGLDCVHALGVVHRDIKPSSILLPFNLLLSSNFLPSRRGAAKLTGFGVAYLDDALPLTVMGDILGAIEYASPEQAHGSGAADARSDVYSLAATAYFALTGTPPFRAADASTQSQLSVMHRQVFSDPPPLRFHRSDLSPAVEEAVLRGLAKAPEARYASAGQFAAALRAAVAASEGEPQQKAMEASARRTGIMAGAAAGAVLLAGLAWAAEHRSKPLAPVSVRVAAVSPAAVTAFKAQATRVLPPLAPKKAVAKKAAAKKVAAKAVPAAPKRSLRLLPIVSAKRLPALVPVARVRAAPGTGWYAVSGQIVLADQPSPSQPLPNQSSPGPQLIPASPAWVKVDGYPLPALALGQWAALPAGTHRVTFQPATGLGVGPKTWTVKIAPSAHLRQQVPLPPAPLPDIPTHLRNP